MAWAKLGTTTLGSAGDDLDITVLTPKKFNVFLIHANGSGVMNCRFNFNNNSNSVYALRENANGGSDSTSVNQTVWQPVGSAADDKFIINYVSSISGEEKLLMQWINESTTTGSGTAPTRREFVVKFVPSPDADITRIDINNSGAGSFDTSSNISALGTD
jgi:hypothetical protein